MKYLVFLLSMLSASHIRPDFISKKRLIIWNVGQGQWLSFVGEKHCSHFDVGGEHPPKGNLIRHCYGKRNQIFISHWDWDHIGLLPFFKKTGLSLCVALLPKKPHPRRASLVQSLPQCQEITHKPLVVFEGDFSLRAKSNSNSMVFVQNQILIPGDSPKQQERMWLENPELHHIKGLILGHHGSRTSTSKKLLENLINLKWAVASARFARYGHPHSEVLSLLKQYRVPLLKTEEWGNIYFEL